MKKIYTILIIALFSFNYLSAQVSHLWGLTSNGGGADSGGTVFKININGSGFNAVHAFDSLLGSGFAPTGGLVQAPNGTLYGMTEYGGNLHSGTIFEYDPGSDLYLKDFDFDYYTTGAYPQGNLVEANDLLYGMTSGGGANGNSKGTIFSFEPNLRTFTHLFDFSDSLGRYPFGSLIQPNPPLGKLYGLASEGGFDSVGTLFSYDITNGAYSILHSFTKTTGSTPYGSLVVGNNGKLYGLTYEGGLNDKGVIFSFDIADSVYTNVYDFDEPTGSNPYGSLISSSEGLLYGMTSNGGANATYGIIFSYDAALDAYTDRFDFGGTNGASPDGDLLQASDGRLYGMTHFGGAVGGGVVFSFDQAGNSYGVLHDLTPANGRYPSGNLVEVLSVGLAEANNYGSISLYPNPASNELRIQNAVLRMKGVNIFSVIGDKLFSLSVSQNMKHETVIDVSSLSAGVYFVEVNFEGGKRMGRFVKE